MADALLSPVVEQLLSIMDREVEQEVRLVVGVENAVDQLTSNLTAIKAVLADAETRQVKEATVINWLGKLKDVAYDIEDVLDDWEAAIHSSQSKPERKVCSFLRSSCFCCKQVGLRHDIARKIRELNERLDRIAREKDQFQFVQREGNPPIERPMTISMIDTTEVKGREEDKNRLVNMLLSEPGDGDGSDLRVLSLVGTGGIGKTTLAQFAFNDDRVNKYFDKKIWICVSDPFNETSIAKEILESLLGNTPNLTTLENLLQKIKQSVEAKKMLLIMDDVWEEDSTKWNKLKQSLRSASPKSKVLVTTRNEKVAGVMGCNNDDILKVGILSDDECWSIVSKIAFSGRDAERNYLEAVGREISKKCKGLPLAAKVVGGILQFRKTREGWQSILDSELWKVEEAQRGILGPLLLSYHDLSPVLKRCFSYCAIFPKDGGIDRRSLIELWMAQGYLKEEGSDNLEMIGENYFQNLTMRSLFQHFGSGDWILMTMHDMVHDLAQWAARDECLGMQVNGWVESIMSSESRKVPRHVSLKCDDYEGTKSFMSFEGTEKLRTLLIKASRQDFELYLTTEELSRLFGKSTHVRSLGLRDCDFAEIPSSIRKLVQLRWLDLSENIELKQLSEELCELHSLQTIDVSGCQKLEQLPLGIGKLFKLRHLYNSESPARLPKGIGQLIGLRTLEEARVGYGDDGASFSLGDLKNLNQLRGSLEISGLGAYGGQVDEAKQAELKQKEHIADLNLSFTKEEPDTTGNVLLLEALEPSPNLESLSIEYYIGTTFPGWMISLTNLKSIRLSSCELCEHLPSLGKLPSLETLYISGMNGVKKVGKELLGIETQIGESKSEISASSASSSSSSPVVVAFPKLTTLIFEHMYDWEEWEDYYNDNYDGTTKPPRIIMPSLLSLYIMGCQRLKALPNYILQNRTLGNGRKRSSKRTLQRGDRRRLVQNLSHPSCRVRENSSEACDDDMENDILYI